MLSKQHQIGQLLHLGIKHIEDQSGLTDRRLTLT